MATLTWQIEMTAGTVNHSGPTISDAQMQRFIDWLWIKFPQVDMVDIEGELVPVEKERTAATEADAFRDWAQIQWHNTKEAVLDHERQQAILAASANVQDIA